MDKFPVQLKIRIDWSELDLFGHVNNVAILKYVQAARVNYWDKIGLSALHLEEKLGPVLLSTSCQFKKPLFYPGNVLIESRFDFIKNSSFGIQHRIVDDQNEIAAEAQDIIVMFDYNTNSKIPFPEDLRRKVELIEGKSFSNSQNQNV